MCTVDPSAYLFIVQSVTSTNTLNIPARQIVEQHFSYVLTDVSPTCLTALPKNGFGITGGQ